MAENPKFEEALEQLEKLVGELEEGELDLDEALKRFEKGVKISKQLNQTLGEAGRKVEKLVLDPEGEARLEPFEESAEEAPEPKRKGKGKSKGQDTLF